MYRQRKKTLKAIVKNEDQNFNSENSGEKKWDQFNSAQQFRIHMTSTSENQEKTENEDTTEDFDDKDNIPDLNDMVNRVISNLEHLVNPSQISNSDFAYMIPL